MFKSSTTLWTMLEALLKSKKPAWIGLDLASREENILWIKGAKACIGQPGFMWTNLSTLDTGSSNGVMFLRINRSNTLRMMDMNHTGRKEGRLGLGAWVIQTSRQELANFPSGMLIFNRMVLRFARRREHSLETIGITPRKPRFYSLKSYPYFSLTERTKTTRH